VAAHTPVFVSGVANDWGECYTDECGPDTPRRFFPLSGNPSEPGYPFPGPRVTEGKQRPGAVIANNMLFWRVTEAGLGALVHQTGPGCPFPKIWADYQPPQRPSIPSSNNRNLAEYLDLDLTRPAAVEAGDPLIQRLRSEVMGLVSSSGHWAPFYYQRGMSRSWTWPYTVDKDSSPPLVMYDSHGSVVFHDPGELLLAGAQAWPYLDSAMQSQLKAWMMAEMARFPALNNLPFFSDSDRSRDWLRLGQVRETYAVPYRGSLNNWPPAAANLNAIYAVWLWSKNTGDWEYARSQFDAARRLFDARVASAAYAGDLAGMIGYYRLAKALGDTAEANRAASAAVSFMNRVRSDPASFLRAADQMYLDPRDVPSGWSAPALFGLVPETGLFLREQTGGVFSDYLIDKEFGSNGNGMRWWYLTRGGAHAEVGETSYLSPLTGWSHFLGHAYLLGDARDDLLPYLDRPWGIADIYSIQKVTAALYAKPKMPDFSQSAVLLSPLGAKEGAEVDLTVYARNTGRPPVGDTAISINLPRQLELNPQSIQIHAGPAGLLAVNSSNVTWTGAFPESGQMTIKMKLKAVTGGRQPVLLGVGVVFTAEGVSSPETLGRLIVNGFLISFPQIRQ